MKKFCDIQSRNELADYLGIPRSKLTHILYVKKPDSYYTTFEIPKRNGDTRAICAPSGDLKVLQKKLSNILCLFQRNIWDENGIKPNISHGFEKEKSIISQYSKDNPLHVLCDPTRYPYSYNENGEMKGIIPDYFRKIADYAGISYEFLTPATRDEYIAYQKNKEVTNISIDARLETDNYAETKKWGLTAPFITMQLARVTRRDFDGEINVVATVDQTASNSIADAMAPGAEKLMCSTRQEMMEAVRKGKADAAFVYYYMAQAFVNSDTTGTMTYTLLEQPTFTYRMVISSNENHALAGILTKAMYAMPKISC